MTQRVLSLASDVLLELQHQPPESDSATPDGAPKTIPREQLHQAILAAFANSTWCQAVLRALEGPRKLQSTALNSMHSFRGHCQWEAPLIQSVISPLQKAWKMDGTIDAEAFQDQFAIMDQLLALSCDPTKI
eukprot:CAMPEP_0172461812 /NCGR_PEP_ID=MMETSP1065-20121228/41812_1 /TAXON_ID=265537 /ORGANISM="Amphiprora paludosa, Strain CCMP125" /LENGTH=131 /DNA_ID=CAMNT_0013217267 /DNA_START=214 /DNA_END=609 /DNA_ORIENTATION=+